MKILETLGMRADDAPVVIHGPGFVFELSLRARRHTGRLVLQLVVARAKANRTERESSDDFPRMIVAFLILAGAAAERLSRGVVGFVLFVRRTDIQRARGPRRTDRVQAGLAGGRRIGRQRS